MHLPINTLRTFIAVADKKGFATEPFRKRDAWPDIRRSRKSTLVMPLIKPIHWTNIAGTPILTVDHLKPAPSEEP